MITNNEFNAIMASEKIFEDDIIKLPLASQTANYHINSIDGRYQLLLDVDRHGSISLKKCKMQERYNDQPIIRLEIDAPPHTNPDGTTTSRNHIHIYREGFGMSWAYDLDDSIFADFNSFMKTFEDFCTYCNIKEMPKLQGVI